MSPNVRWGYKQIEKYEFLLKSQWWSNDQLEAYQWDLLKQLLTHAYTKTIFYKERFDKVGAHPSDIKSLADFAKLPCVTKDDVREHLEEMKSADFSSLSPVKIRTGGSTGTPLFSYKSENAEQMREATAWRTRKFGGIEFDERKVTINHSTLAGRYRWHVDFRSNTLQLFTAQTSDTDLELFVALINKFEPRAIVGSVGFMRLLGHFVEASKVSLESLRAIFVVGEAISPEDREAVLQQLGCKLYDAYGMRENAVSASECAEGNLHINSEFTLLEFDGEGSHGTSRNQAHIIGTNLHNLAVPLIRYSTEDVGCVIQGKCPCGRRLSMMKIIGGRSRDFLITRSGYVFVTWHLCQMIDEHMGVEKIQLYQPDSEDLIVRIVRRAEFSEFDERRILDQLQRLTANELKIRFEYLSDIPRTPMGKFRFVVSDLLNKFINKDSDPRR